VSYCSAQKVDFLRSPMMMVQVQEESHHQSQSKSKSTRVLLLDSSRFKCTMGLVPSLYCVLVGVLLLFWSGCEVVESKVPPSVRVGKRR